jgi:hypothetical protein
MVVHFYSGIGNRSKKKKNKKQKTKNEKRKTKNEKRKTKNEKRKTKNEACQKKCKIHQYNALLQLLWCIRFMDFFVLFAKENPGNIYNQS